MTEGEPVELDGMKLAAARLWATNRHPYLASAVFAAPTTAAPGLGRIMIDRWWRIHADPEVVAGATVEQVGGELLHLTSHVLRDHAARADALRFSQVEELHHWVDAADAEIADDFDADLARISSPVRAEDLAAADGRLAEEYYRRGEVRTGETNDCGSGAHGEPPDWEPPPPPPDGEDGSDDEAGIDRAGVDRAGVDRAGVDRDSQELIRRNVAAEIARTEAEAVSESLRRWAEHRLQPTVDWRAELAASMRRAVSMVSGAVDYSYRRPSRRSTAVEGVVLPSMQRPTVEVAVVIDTSASVDEIMLGAAVAEVDGLLRATGIRSVRILACDDAVRTADRVTSGRTVDLLGGGGTDMSVGLDAALGHRPRPDLVVVLTDGFTPWPPSAPPVPVVVGLLGVDEPSAIESPAGAPTAPPAWARSIPIPADGALV